MNKFGGDFKHCFDSHLKKWVVTFREATWKEAVIIQVCGPSEEDRKEAARRADSLSGIKYPAYK